MAKSVRTVFIIRLLFVLLFSLNQAYSMEPKDNDPSSSSPPAKRVKRSIKVQEVYGVREAILKDNITSKKLKDANKKYFSERLQKDAELYLCDENSFDNLFPINTVGSDLNLTTDKSYFSGQIRITKNDDGLGTGTVVGMKEDSDGKIIITGITALHNFVGFDKKGINIPLPGDRKFSLGSKHHTSDGMFSLGHAEIDRVVVPSTPSKDICLFEGFFSRNEKLFDTEKEFYEQFKPNLPVIVTNEMTSTDTYSGILYHYPLGKKDQRQNKGEALGTGQHKIESLFGSSGAALFDDNFKIFGIHTGVSGNDLYKDAVVEYDGIEDIPVSNFNSFEKISYKDYNDACTGVEILRGYLSKEFKVKLSSLVESLSILH